jgi:hypothetical protein
VRSERVHSEPRPGRHLRRALGLLALTISISACHDEQSFIVVTVQSMPGKPVAAVSTVEVTVSNGGNTTSLTYPAPGDTPFTIDTTGKTLGVAFSAGRPPSVTLTVTARTKGGCIVGTGQNMAQIKRNGVNTATVVLTAIFCQDSDGAAMSPDEGVTFAGCDPTAPATCGSAMTCVVDCTDQQAKCAPGGTGAPGSLCGQNADCAPGTQCFRYGGAGTVACNVDGGQVGVCLKFCKADSDCGGGGSLCRGPVTCPGTSAPVMTAYHTCTFGCDPRGAATQGCPSSLRCFVVDTMDQVDCACPELSRTQQEGQECDHSRGLDCVPGMICNAMNGTLRCRKVCKRSENGADCGAGQVCETLSNDQIYGACL